MFERYTEKARRVIFFARYEASQFGSPYIETEHLLLGLLREEDCFAAQILKERGLRLSLVREELGRQPHEVLQAPQKPSVLDELSPYLSESGGPNSATDWA
jgi:ATP-dependent Clp protease ATP-binding subunit ClpA